MTSMQSIQAGKAHVAISVDTAKLNDGIQKANAILRQFAGNAAKIFRDVASTHYSLQNIVQPVINAYAGFDDQMRLTRAVTGATADQFQLLTDRAKQLGRDTAFTAAEVASGMTALGRMGFSSAEIDRATADVMNLARATGSDLSAAADIAANSLRIFGLQATDMTRVADVLTATANGSAQTLHDLFEALKTAGPQAATAKESITDVAAAIGVMANVGIKGSLAGNALRRAYVNLTRTKVQEYLRQYNVETVDASGNLLKMKDILIGVSKAMQTMGTAQKMAFAEEVFDMRGSFVGLTLGGNIQGMQDFITQLEQADGVAAKTAADMEAGLGGAMRLLKSAFEGVVIAIGETIDGTVSFAARFSTDVLRGLASFIKAVPQLSSVVGGLALVIVPAVAALATFAIGMKAVSVASVACSGAINMVNLALTALSAHPIIAILTVIAAALTMHVARLRTLAREIDNTRQKQAQLNAELAKQEKASQDTRQDTRRATGDFQRLQELAQLSRQQRLTNRELLEADAIIQRLEPYGASYFAQLDTVARSLSLTTDAQRAFTSAIHARQIPALEAERDKIQEVIAAIEAERDAIIKRQGVRAVMRNQVAEEQAARRIEPLQAKVTELQAQIDQLQEPINLQLDTDADLPPSIAQLEQAAKSIQEMEASLRAAGMTMAERQLEEIEKQNAAYREQIKLLSDVAETKSASAKQTIAQLEAQKSEAAFADADSRAAAIAAATEKLTRAQEEQAEEAANLESWEKWQGPGHELHKDKFLSESQMRLVALNMQVEKLQEHLEELNKTPSTAEIQLQIDAELVNLSQADAAMQELQNRLEQFEAEAQRQKNAVETREASQIMSDIDKQDRQRQLNQEQESWRRAVNELFKSPNLGQAFEAAAAAMSQETADESRIRDDLAAAQSKNATEEMRRLAEELRQSQARQDYLARAMEQATDAQQRAEGHALSTPFSNLASFITSDILNLMAAPSGPEEETARNTRTTANNLASLIDIVRDRRPPAFS
jgi:TP901 family phage tail tape measure protein